MAACWKGIGSLLSECVPSIIEGSSATVAPDTQTYMQDASASLPRASSSDDVTTEIENNGFHTNLCTASTSTRYSSYAVSSNSRNSFIIANPERFTSPESGTAINQGASSRLRGASPDTTSGSTSEITPIVPSSALLQSSTTSNHRPCIILPGLSSIAASATSRSRKNVLDRRRRTSSCSRCGELTASLQGMGSTTFVSNQKCQDHGNNDDRNGSGSSGGSGSNASSSGFRDATLNGREGIELRQQQSSMLRSRRRSSSLSAGIIGLGGRGPSARYLIVRPMTNTVTHTLGKHFPSAIKWNYICKS